ncbi:parathymosin [Prorops nasuta]|uniref:parathymosin n=1 Tax=Prorops nasuta TaxID=863751 RepID=UPI0034CFA539
MKSAPKEAEPQIDNPPKVTTTKSQPCGTQVPGQDSPYLRLPGNEDREKGRRFLGAQEIVDGAEMLEEEEEEQTKEDIESKETKNEEEKQTKEDIDSEKIKEEKEEEEEEKDMESKQTK